MTANPPKKDDIDEAKRMKHEIAKQTQRTPRLGWRLARRVAVGIGVSILILALSIGLAIGFVNTSKGRVFLAGQVSRLSGNMVRIQGLTGRFPSKIAIARLQISDTQGAWLTAQGVRLRWHPMSLLGRHILIDVLEAKRLDVIRGPQTSEASPPQTVSKTSVPSYMRLGLQLKRLDLQQIVLGRAILGLPVSLGVHGATHIKDLGELLNGFDPHHLPTGMLKLAAERQDADGNLTVEYNHRRSGLELNVVADDPTNRFLSRLVTRPSNAALHLRLTAHGSSDAISTYLETRLGGERVNANGVVNLVAKEADITLDARTAQMKFAQGFGWDRLRAQLQLSGAWKAPVGKGALTLDGLETAAVRVAHADFKLQGARLGQGAKDLHLNGQISGLKTNASKSAPFGAAPINLQVGYQPDARGAPVDITLQHPLLDINSHIDTADALTGRVSYHLHDLAPWAALSQIRLHGDAKGAFQFELPNDASGDVRGSGAADISLINVREPWGKLVAGRSRLEFAGAQHKTHAGVVYDLKNLSFVGPQLTVTAQGFSGTTPNQPLDLRVVVHTPQLAALSPMLKGDAIANATAKGTVAKFKTEVQLDTHFGVHGAKPGPLKISAAFAGLPYQPYGTLDATGVLDGSALALKARLDVEDNGTRRLRLSQLGWRGVSGRADLRLPKEQIFPRGTATLEVADLGHFSALAGRKLAGHLNLDIATRASHEAASGSVEAHLKGNVKAPRFSIGKLAFDAKVAAPESMPRINADLQLENIIADQLEGQVRMHAEGTQSALTTQLRGRFKQLYGTDFSVLTNLVSDLPRKTARIQKLDAQSKDVKIRAMSPMRAFWGDKLGLEDINLKLTRPSLPASSLKGHALIKPKLAVQLALKGMRPGFLAPFVPKLNLDGLLSADAVVFGQLDSPQGRLRLQVRHLKATSGEAASLPPAMLDVNADLRGKAAQLRASASAGSRMQLTLAGHVPFEKTASLNVTSRGRVDLALLNAITAVSGVAIQGHVATDLRARGCLAKPSLTGRLTLQKTSVSDYARGVSIHDVEGYIESASDHLVLHNITGRAGAGTIRLAGTIGVLQKDRPVNLSLEAKNARPIASEVLTAVTDASLNLTGQLSGALMLAGRVTLKAVNVNIPDSFPPEVPQLHVIRRDQIGKEEDDQSKEEGVNPVKLKLVVTSPGEFYVRGHGLDAEMMGSLQIGGTSSAPNVVGNFDMRRGDFNLAGVDLTFSEGVVGFNGSGVTQKLDPSINFRADRNVQGTIASLTVSGTASAPKIDFTSAPSFPQDQVLAMLLFGRPTPQLTTSQMASVAAALAQLAGGSNAFDPLTKVRNILGLDRLAVGGGSGLADGGANVEAGKYVAKGIYVGAKQATSGGGTQAQVQIDLTKRLKLNTTVGTGGLVTGFTTPENDPGSSVGLSYGLDY